MMGSGGGYSAGTLFSITPSGTFTLLRSFNPHVDGGGPTGAIVIQKPSPKANDQSVTTTMNTAKTITLTGSGGSPLQFFVLQGPKNGSLTGSGASRTYTPFSGYVGKDSLKFYVTWGCERSSTATVRITVNSSTTLTSQARAASSEKETTVTSDKVLNAYVVPNPVFDRGQLVVQTRSTAPKTIYLLDMLGRIYSQVHFSNNGSNSYDFSVKGLAAGLYLIMVQQGDSKTYTRLVVY
jgi:hypothetical protein